MRLVRFVTIAVSALAVAATPASAATPRVTAKPARVVEGGTAGKTVRVQLRLSRKAGARASVRYRTRSGTAGASDFGARRGTIRFRRGSRRATVRLRIRGDALAEADESFTLRLSSPRRVRLGRLRAVRITIVDDDPAPAVAVPTATVADAVRAEPAEPGAVAAHGLAVVLSEAAPAEVRVDYEIVATGATTAADMEVARGTAVFAAGQTRSVLPGVIRGDALDEADETAVVLLTNPVGVRLPDPQATLTIADDPADVPPGVSIGDATVSEAAGAASLAVTLSAPSGRSVKVGYATVDGTADAADHPAESGTVTFAPGSTEATVTVAVTDDGRDEDAQAFTVALSQPDAATIADGDGSVSIEDDDAPPTVSIDDVSRLEDNTVAAFTLTLSAASEKAITMRAGTIAATAVGGPSCGAGTDYVALSDLPVGIEPGQLTGTLNVSICEDATDEPTETATVQLSQIVNATAGDPSGLLTILDDE